MNETLKGVANIGAELGAAMAEIEVLREQVKVLQSDANSWQSGYDKGRNDGGKHRKGEVEQLRGLLREISDSIHGGGRVVTFMDDDIAAIDAALSQQAEPVDTYTAVDMATAAAQAFRDGQAATVKDSLTVQPMAYAVFAANGNVACFSTQRDHPSLVALEADGHSVVSLAPITQAEQQLFTVPDGYVLVPEDQIIESDDYGIYGSTFHYCKLCQSESGAGMLNKGIPHKPGCALSSPPSPAMDAKEE